MKLIGIVILTLTGFAVGKCSSIRFSTRVVMLEKILLMFEIIESQIKFCAVPINEILEKLNTHKELDSLIFLDKCNKRYFNCTSFSQLWEDCIKTSNIGLFSEDEELLCSFGNSLGTTDVIGQINFCQLHKNLAQEHLNVARKENQKFSKLHTSLGTMGGIFLAVVLM